MEFRKLEEPTFFLASPGDVSEAREAIKNAFDILCGQTANDKGIKIYAWESETSKSGFDQWQPPSVQIPLPSDLLCKAVVFVFGERIGTPLTDAPSRDHIEKLVNEGLIRLRRGKYHLKLDWEKGTESDGGFPLTGTVFELLVTLAAQKTPGNVSADTSTKRGNPPFKILFVGDNTVLEAIRSESNEKIEDANWGNHEFYRMGTSKVPPSQLIAWYQDYKGQIKQLRNFIGYLKQCEVHIDEYSIVHNAEAAGIICKEFLKEKLGYKTGNPFKGLSFYDFNENDLFYGRDNWVKKALEEFESCWSARYIPFYGITGGGGVGKTSLLRAGMIANLKDSNRYNPPYKATIFQCNDFITDKQAETATNGLSENPLCSLVESALYNIFDQRSGEVKSGETGGQTPLCLAEKDERLIAQTLAELNREDSPEHFSQAAVRKLIAALDRCAENECISPHEKLRLVIGLDQFEELLDVLKFEETANKAKLELLFSFFQYACESKRIGFIYTCQTNRLEILENDPKLGLLCKSSKQKEVFHLDDYDELIRRMFLHVDISLAEETISKIVRRVEGFSNDLRLTKPSKESDKESEATLLPLLSLTLQNLYEYCEHRRPELLQKQKERAENEKREAKDSSQASMEYSNEAASHVSNFINDENTLVIEHEDIKEDILDVENAIKAQIDKALKETLEFPRVNWSEDILAILLRRLIRIHPDDDDHYNLLQMLVPQRGDGKILVDQFRRKRLLIPVGINRVRLVHEAVIKNWTAAQEWLEKEKELLRAYKKTFRQLARFWHDNKSDEMFRSVSAEKLDLAGKFLFNWWEVFQPKDGTQPHPEDQLLCDFVFFLLETAMTPSEVVKGFDSEISHFLIAVYYGRTELVRKYLETDPWAAQKHRSSKGKRAAYLAALGEDLKTLNLVLENGANPTEADESGFSPIMVAAYYGNTVLLDRLAEAGADPMTPNKEGWTSLHFSAYHDDVKTLSHLLKSYAADPNFMGDLGWTPLHLSCRHASQKTVKVLINRTETEVNLLTKEGWSPLHLAIFGKSPEIVSLLLHDERIDRTIKTPTTPKKSLIEFAIDEFGNKEGKTGLEIIKTLLNDPFQKINPDSASDNVTPLFKACSGRKIELARLLINAGADVNSESDGKTPFLVAAERGDNKILQLLLPKANLYQKSGDGRTALHLAATKGHVETIAILLDYLKAQKGDLRDFLYSYDSTGRAPVHIAAEAGYGEVVETLLRYDNTLFDVSDLLGRKVAHIAAKNNHTDFLTKFANFDPNVKDSQGMSCLHYAVCFGSTEFVKRLLERGDVDPDASDDYGWTPLHLSSQNGDLEITEELLKKGAHKFIVGKTPPLLPLEAAAAAGQTDVIELLFSDDSKRESDVVFLDKAIFLAAKNAQFETALKLLELQNENLRR